jgi:uncharacterized protein YjeT (DUF2065 family)
MMQRKAIRQSFTLPKNGLRPVGLMQAVWGWQIEVREGIVFDASTLEV